MAHPSRFLIRNKFSNPLTLNVEPEGAFFPLPPGEEVAVTDTHTQTPVTLKFTVADNGDPVLFVWPGDGVVRIDKDGVDVLDLIQECVEV